MSHPVVEWAGRVITILLLLAGSGLMLLAVLSE